MLIETHNADINSIIQLEHKHYSYIDINLMECKCHKNKFKLIK